jgi:hypothetical protein
MASFLPNILGQGLYQAYNAKEDIKKLGQGISNYFNFYKLPVDS